MLGLDQFIKRACEVDYAGEAVLEFLFSILENELTILCQKNCGLPPIPPCLSVMPLTIRVYEARGQGPFFF